MIEPRRFAETPERPFAIGVSQTSSFAAPSTWAERFAAERAIVCRDIFEPALLDRLVAASRATQYEPGSVPGLGEREVEMPQRVGSMINLLLQRPSLFRWLEAISGHAQITGAEGRLVQTRPGGDALTWHDDLSDPCRTLGITINFTQTTYRGGLFEMRRTGDPASSWAFEHARVGTALIFDLGRDLEHRLHPLTAGGPRRVFTGWFTTRPVVLTAPA